MGECTQLTWSEKALLMTEGFVVRKRYDGDGRSGSTAVRIWVNEDVPTHMLPPGIQRILSQPGSDNE